MNEQIQGLLVKIESNSPEALEAIQTLFNLPRKRGISHLVKLVEERKIEHYLRQQIRDQLFRLSDQHTIMQVEIWRLDFDSETARIEAATRLANFRHQKVIDALNRRLYESDSHYENKFDAGRAILKAMVKIHDPQFAPTLLKYFDFTTDWNLGWMDMVTQTLVDLDCRNLLQDKLVENWRTGRKVKQSWLEKIMDEQFVLKIEALYTEESSDTRHRMELGAFLSTQTANPDILIELLTHREWRIRQNAATRLGKVEHAKAQFMAERLNLENGRFAESDADVRWALVQSLAELNDPVAIPQFKALAFYTGHPKIFIEKVRATLEKWGVTLSVEERWAYSIQSEDSNSLQECIQEIVQTDSEETAEFLVLQLPQIKKTDDDQLDRVLKYLSKYEKNIKIQKSLATHAYWEGRIEAISLLQEICPREELIELLMQRIAIDESRNIIIEDDSDVRAKILDVFLSLNAVEAVEAVRTMLLYEDSGTCSELIFKILNQAGVGLSEIELVAFLDSPNHLVRRSALQELKSCKSPNLTKILFEVFRDSGDEATAIEVLRSIGAIGMVDQVLVNNLRKVANNDRSANVRRTAVGVMATLLANTIQS